MQRWRFALAFGLSFLPGAGMAQDRGQAAVVTTIRAFTEAVNRGDFPGAIAHFTSDPVITEDLAPYRFSEAQRWHELDQRNRRERRGSWNRRDRRMELSNATRVDVAADRAYAIVPGKLIFTTKDARHQSADGALTFVLERSWEGWKISTLTWTGLPPR